MLNFEKLVSPEESSKLYSRSDQYGTRGFSCRIVLPFAEKSLAPIGIRKYAMAALLAPSAAVEKWPMFCFQ